MHKPFIYQETQADKTAFMKRGDAWAISSDSLTFAVADSPLRRLTIAKRDYPYDDLGGEFADLFCNKFVEYSDSLTPDSEVSEMHEVLSKVNQDIKLENEKKGKVYDDPNNYDMGEVVAAGITIKDGVLFYGLLEDCYVNVLRGEGLVDQVKLDYQIVKSSKEIDFMASQGRLTDFMTEEVEDLLPESDYWEPMWCTKLRNNPEITNEKGDKVGWGIFNGEKKAEEFFQVGKIELQPDDQIFVFTDGMIPILESKEMLAWIIKEAQPSFKSQYQFRKKIEELLAGKSALHKEKTLIYLNWQG